MGDSYCFVIHLCLAADDELVVVNRYGNTCSVGVGACGLCSGYVQGSAYIQCLCTSRTQCACA